MPARSNDFQRLIYLVKHNLAPGATVTESKILLDLVSGDEVEVDVYIEGKVGDDSVNVYVECRDRSRRADSNWVHEMKAKHERLPTSALILASSRGFSKRAVELARSYGIQTAAVEDVESNDYPTMLQKSMALWAKSVSFRAERITFVMELPKDADASEPERVRGVPTQEIWDEQGTLCMQASELVNFLITAPTARDFLLNEGRPEHVWFNIEWVTENAPRCFFGEWIRASCGGYAA